MIIAQVGSLKVEIRWDGKHWRDKAGHKWEQEGRDKLVSDDKRVSLEWSAGWPDNAGQKG